MIDLVLPAWTVAYVHLCILLVFIIGMLCFFVRRSYIRQILGLKLMLQSVTLGLVITGWQYQDYYLAQSMVITALIIEAIVIGLALTLIIQIAKHPHNETITSQGDRVSLQEDND
jgi:NADH:ubiquinone oxidoreductase subunit K